MGTTQFKNMTSFGAPRQDKFYKGHHSDTAWNKDLLWKKFVNMEAKELKKPKLRFPKRKNNIMPVLSTRSRMSSAKMITARSISTGYTTGRSSRIQTSVEIAAIIEQKVTAEKRRRQEFEALLKQMERRLEQAKRQEIDELTREINRVQQITTPRT